MYILRCKNLTVRNSAHRKNWPNCNSKRIPRELGFELFCSCPVARRHCLMQLRTKMRQAPKNISCRDLLECSSRECVTKVTQECGLQTGTMGAICTPILAFVSIVASIKVSLGRT